MGSMALIKHVRYGNYYRTMYYRSIHVVYIAIVSNDHNCCRYGNGIYFN